MNMMKTKIKGGKTEYIELQCGESRDWGELQPTRTWALITNFCQVCTHKEHTPHIVMEKEWVISTYFHLASGLPIAFSSIWQQK